MSELDQPGGPQPREGGGAIFSGVGPPSDVLGASGDFYLDTESDILYGPKALGPGYLISASATPAVSQPGDYRLANTFKLLGAGAINGARFWRNAGSVQTSRSLYLYDDTTQALLATSNPTVEGSGQVGWIEATFPTPVAVTANQVFAIAYDEPNNNSYANGAALVGDPLVVSALGAKWAVPAGAPLYPITSSGAFNFFTDLLFQPAGAADEVWPIALQPGGGLDQDTADARYVNVAGDAMSGALTIYNTALRGYSSGGSPNDALGIVSTNAGAAMGVQNLADTGYSGIEYRDHLGNTAVFTGYNNSAPGEFRFNNIASNARIIFKLGSVDQLSLLPSGIAANRPIALPANPTNALEATTKQYVDSRIVQLTQAEYDALASPDPNVLYVVVG